MTFHKESHFYIPFVPLLCFTNKKTTTEACDCYILDVELFNSVFKTYLLRNFTHTYETIYLKAVNGIFAFSENVIIRTFSSFMPYISHMKLYV